MSSVPPIEPSERPDLQPAPTPVVDPPAEPASARAAPAAVATTPALTFERSTWLPTSTAGRVAAVCCLLLLAAYCGWTMTLRLAGIFDPFSADGDQAQAVWHYWRYNISGLFPAGDFLTDYSFKMHAPPVWWLMMASLSTIFEPVFVAKLWNIAAYALTLIVTIVAIGKRSNVFIGMACAFLLARNVDFSTIIAGGYARSFGPMLTMLFLGVFMAGRHRLALAVLVFQAALYPSVVIPCGIAYGLYTVIKGPMPLRLRQMGGMFIAGLMIIGFGKSQDIGAPEWWGPLVTLEEASKLEVWGPGGRVPETPLRPMKFELEKNAARAFRVAGPTASPALTTAVTRQLPELPLALFALTGIAFAALLVVRRRQGRAVIDPFPWQVPLLAAGALAAYVLARMLAFRLYLPYRPLQHVLPYTMYATIALMTWTLIVNVLPRRRALATVLAVFLIVVPTVVTLGTGHERGPGTYSSYRWHAGYFAALRKLPKNVMVAGDFTNTSSGPLFGHVLVYVNKNLAHPFRLGFWNEAERRIIGSYTALYATTLDEVIAFAEAEKIDYLTWQVSTLQKPEKRLFRPVKKPLDALFRKNKAKGFALAKPLPKEAVVYKANGTTILDMKKLAAAHRANKAKLEAEPVPTAPVEGDKADADSGTGGTNTPNDALDERPEDD